MQYTRLGNTGKKISRLSLGCMRFQNQEQAAEVVNASLNHGINYFETSCEYCHDQGEEWLGKGLGDRRMGILVSTKSPPGEKGYMTADEVRSSIDESLRRLKVDYLDFYHAWRTNTPERYEACVRGGGWLDGAHQAMDEGLIKHLGITSHATPELLLKILDDDIFEVLTVQYSVVLQGYRDVVRRAREKGIGVVIMGPLGGGLLVQSSPLLDKVFASDRSVVGALKYVLCDPGVSSVASGMMTAAEVKDNCQSVDAMPAEMTFAYQNEIDTRIRDALGEDYEELSSTFCQGCRYCTSVCPQGLFAPIR